MLDPRLRDFRNFAYVMLDHMGVGEPTPVQQDMASFLQDGPDYGDDRPTVRRIMLQLQRGEGKSWYTSFYVLWRLALDPNLKVLVVSASESRAAAFTTFCLQLIKDVPCLRFLEPRKDGRQSALMFDVAPAKVGHDASLRAVGVLGQMAGAHPDLIVGDDLEVPNNSDTVQAREKLAERVKEFAAMVNPGGSIVLLGTPQNEDTIYERLIERGYWIRVWPGRYPPYGSATVEQYEARGDRGRKELAPFIAERMEGMAGRPTDPARFNELDLQEREADYKASGFQLQFMLNPHLADAERRPLRLADLVTMDLDAERAPRRVVWTSKKPLQNVPHVGLSGDRLNGPAHVDDAWDPYDLKLMAVDPAGRGKDELAWAIIGLSGGMLFLLDWGGTLGGYDRPELDLLAARAQRFGVQKVVVEANFGDGMFTELFRPVLLARCQATIEDVKVKGRKERRIIDTLEPVLSQHRMVADREALVRDYRSAVAHDDSAAVAYCGMHQLTRITPDPGCLKHDDRLDALSLAVSACLGALGLDVDAFARMRGHRQTLDELDEEHRDLFGRSMRHEGLDNNRGHRIIRGPRSRVPL
jgi:Autographiviridae terminase large subunit